MSRRHRWKSQPRRQCNPSQQLETPPYRSAPSTGGPMIQVESCREFRSVRAAKRGCSQTLGSLPAHRQQVCALQLNRAPKVLRSCPRPPRSPQVRATRISPLDWGVALRRRSIRRHASQAFSRLGLSARFGPRGPAASRPVDASPPRYWSAASRAGRHKQPHVKIEPALT